MVLFHKPYFIKWFWSTIGGEGSKCPKTVHMVYGQPVCINLASGPVNVAVSIILKFDGFQCAFHTL